VLSSLGMTFRITESEGERLLFEGALDREAVEVLRARLAGRRTRLVLRRGTTVEPDCWDGLRSLGADVVAESPHLARWLESDGRR
jgi:hypothetical protein